MYLVFVATFQFSNVQMNTELFLLIASTCTALAVELLYIHYWSPFVTVRYSVRFQFIFVATVIDQESTN